MKVPPEAIERTIEKCRDLIYNHHKYKSKQISYNTYQKILEKYNNKQAIYKEATGQYCTQYMIKFSELLD